MTEDTIHTHRFCVAPMMDGTDRHCRYFHRQMSKHARLYTEMVTADAILHGDRDYLLGFEQSEHPVALQLGGSNATALAEAARIGEDFGYDEINLNVGCPSDRVQSGTFGACLMKTPDLVADCVAAMRSRVSVPVTVKSRIGVDDQEPGQVLPAFIDKVAKAGCEIFIIHARKAWLQGLSPKENRTVPPLDYALVRQMKRDKPGLSIILNGGLETIAQCQEELPFVDGVMLGREPYANPWLLSEVDETFFGEAVASFSREEIAMAMHDYIADLVMASAHKPHTVKPHAITRHMIGLFKGTPGARYWRRALSGGANLPVDIVPRALEQLAKAQVSAA